MHQIELEMQNEELRRSQAELDTLRSHYFDLYELAPAGYVTVGEQGLILQANLIAATLLGAARGELLGKPLSRFILEEDEAVYYRLLGRLPGSDTPQSCELRLARGGAPCWVSMVATLAPGAGGAPAIRWVLVDVTERKRTEEALRASEARWQFALEGAGDGVWDWNIATNEVYYSPRWKSMLGYTDAELGNTLEVWSELLHPQDIESVMAKLHQHFSGTTPDYGCEQRLRCKDGSYRWVLDRGKVVERAVDGRPLRAIGTHKDITERKLHEEAQLESAERISALSRRLIEAQEEERAQLARELHDELGQVLTGVRLHLKVVERGDAPEGSIGKALKAVEVAIKQVRSLSLNLRPPLLDELGLVAALREMARQYSENARLRVSVEAPAEKMALHRNLSDAAYRIAQEALTNAMRHAHAREAVICVEPGGARLVLTVRDDGCGFDQGRGGRGRRWGGELGQSLAQRDLLLGLCLELTAQRTHLGGELVEPRGELCKPLPLQHRLRL
ncbi:MAG: PAS domain S-box protein, partial [Proteobacteria bacterium]|nr:PAS domain S-box protein [Pseudomonadota bacterium]